MVRTGQTTCMSNNWDETCEAKLMALRVIIEIIFYSYAKYGNLTGTVGSSTICCGWG